MYALLTCQSANFLFFDCLYLRSQSIAGPFYRMIELNKQRTDFMYVTRVCLSAHAKNAFKFWPHGVVVILIVLLITLCGFFLFKRYKPTPENDIYFASDTNREQASRQDATPTTPTSKTGTETEENA